MDSISIPARLGAPSALLRSRRLLALASDERLVDQIRQGNDVAFEVVFERYGARILTFCRHLLGSREEAEDAVQHTFAAAYAQLLRDDREIALRAWLYTIARHRCVSLLRARRELPTEVPEMETDDLPRQVERRAELRELLADLAQLPEEQRSALLLAEAGDLSHADIAAVLDCEAFQVKALVYRARSSLISRRDARALPCEQVREQLSTLRGGALRRLELTHHLDACAGCREYREQVERQRRLLGAALPVVPSAALKASVLSASGVGGAAGGGGLLLGAIASVGGGAGAAKVAAVAGLAVGAAAGVGVVAERAADGAAPPAVVAPAPNEPSSTRGGLDATWSRGAAGVVPALGGPRSTERAPEGSRTGGPPEHAKARGHDRGGPPAHAKAHGRDRGGPPAHAKARGRDRGGPPAHAKARARDGGRPEAQGPPGGVAPGRGKPQERGGGATRTRSGLANGRGVGALGPQRGSREGTGTQSAPGSGQRASGGSRSPAQRSGLEAGGPAAAPGRATGPAAERGSGPGTSTATGPSGQGTAGGPGKPAPDPAP